MVTSLITGLTIATSTMSPASVNCDCNHASLRPTCYWLSIAALTLCVTASHESTCIEINRWNVCIAWFLISPLNPCPQQSISPKMTPSIFFLQSLSFSFKLLVTFILFSILPAGTHKKLTRFLLPLTSALFSNCSNQSNAGLNQESDWLSLRENGQQK